MSEDLMSKTLEELTTLTVFGASFITQNDAKAEIARRQAVAQIESAKAAAASARIAMISVIILAITSALQLAVAIGVWLFPHSPR